MSSGKGNPPLILGIDVGSVSIDIVLLSQSHTIQYGSYTRHHGQPDTVLYTKLSELEKDYSFSTVAITGTGAKRLAALLGGHAVNEVVAQVEAANNFYPQARAIIDIGGQDSQYIQLEETEKGTLRLKDFSVSSMCASGTGSFLDQQAARLNLSIDTEFAREALRSSHPARIAGRCSVFAKSDMIHLQQKGTPVQDIVAGLCHALVRGFKSSVVGTKNLQPPIAVVGGVAANDGVIAALHSELKLEKNSLFRPDNFALSGALGAAAFILSHPTTYEKYKGANNFKHELSKELTTNSVLQPLPVPTQKPMQTSAPLLQKGEKIPAFLGIDIGSISTNLVLIDTKCNVLSKQYLMTASQPIKAVKEGLENLQKRFAHAVEIKGVATTGSGRHLIGDLVGADIMVNEITAHAKAAVFSDPQVDTIFEIGGQDSKYVHLSNGVVDDFTMNKACAAGTGSFLEEQAERLNISIKKDFSDMALSAPTPVNCGEQCTVFIESEVIRHQQNGTSLADITAGLAFSIATNYLHKVIENRAIGNHILFQGGVAFNTAVHSAFEVLTGKKLIVPEHHEVMGALGCCLLAKETYDAKDISASHFLGFNSLQHEITQKSFQCNKCENRCDIIKVTLADHPPLFYGGRCERYEVRRHENVTTKLPDLIAAREQLMFFAYQPRTIHPAPKGTIGYPRVLTFHEYYPFFNAFFNELGFSLLLSPQTNSTIIRNGVGSVASATCFPTKIAHGHVAWMKQAIQEGKADYMFIPSIRETFPTCDSHPYANHCSYIQYIPDLTNEAFSLEEEGIPLLKPSLHFRLGKKQMMKELLKTAKQIGITSKKAVSDAFQRAMETQRKFTKQRIELGEKCLQNLPPNTPTLILSGKMHNIYDAGTNLNIGRIFRERGILVIPMDLLDLQHSPEVGEAWRNMTLAMGQKTLVVADAVRKNPNLHAVYLANFGCVNDSIYPDFFKREMGDKPFLLLEIDEHSAEAGVITRCEAFLDAISNKTVPASIPPHRITKKEYDPDGERVLYLPHAANGMGVWAAALRASGVNAQILPPPDDRSLHWGRTCLNGKECLPCTLMTGDMLRLIKDTGMPPEKTAFFMPGSCGSCRYDLFNTLQQVVFEDMGLEDVVLVDEYKNANQKLHSIMSSKEYGLLAWKGFIAADILEKLRMHIRPYEISAGTTDLTYKACLAHVISTIEKNGNVEEVIAHAVDLFAVIERQTEQRPVIGLVGEAYLRNVDYASDHLISKLEKLGVEVHMPAIMEVLWYSLYKERYYKAQGGETLSGMFLKLQHSMLTAVEKKLRRHTKSILPHPFEARVWDTIAKSGFTLDAGLGFGAALEIASHGVQGIVHAIPFNCVPGLMIQGLEKRFRRMHPQIPFLTVAFHGHNDPSVEIRLEALVHQCKEIHTQFSAIKKTA
ncbi:acyl-CoA dehydratase activase [Halodesulfovibrio aestuarii]|uniref:CoA-substrate-specific enzyme activase, putative n=1 Tax=Halodesulfovibrio aestuarii TaxID=126333 RepID=A0A8G2CBH7_9BACT|nr:acyl-CoA dehydratase activase [Halodesulfovibrio aestuarii]SHJ55796.1 CoA-substrate-specific enzyme activase, putative [Halodesulfovibrio aestuarii]